MEEPEVGHDVPAVIGMDESEIQTPCLILDLDALERNIARMGDYAKTHGMRHRIHGKMHKSVDVAKLQERSAAVLESAVRRFPSAKVFTGEIDQSASIGEAQHAFAEGLITKGQITPLGEVVSGTHPGCSDDEDIALFDSTGVGLQDLAVAGAVARKAMEAGTAQTARTG